MGKRQLILLIKELIAIKRYMVLSIILILFLPLTACTKEEDLIDAVFEGTSENWHVVLEIERLETPGSDLTYIFSYIGEGVRPDVFFYDLAPNTPISSLEEGSLKDQDEMWASIAGDTEPINRRMPIHITINWNNESEEVLVKLKKD